ncbi:VOC family protein [Ferruginibacter yonginensis]|uniref:VOC family protein n=1 Tax=Ferruginibacter yonginensis TaxID=1310416 RepID=A0ABV8QPJ5_9BACT
MKINCIHHVAIITDQYEASKHFYVNILGFNVVQEVYREARNSYKLDLSINGQYQIELFSFDDVAKRASYPEAKGLRHLAFEVDDVEAAVAHLQQHGVATEPIRIDEYSNKKFCFFYDPNGQPLELYASI